LVSWTAINFKVCAIRRKITDCFLSDVSFLPASDILSYVTSFQFTLLLKNRSLDFTFILMEQLFSCVPRRSASQDLNFLFADVNVFKKYMPCCVPKQKVKLYVFVRRELPCWFIHITIQTKEISHWAPLPRRMFYSLSFHLFSISEVKHCVTSSCIVLKSPLKTCEVASCQFIPLISKCVPQRLVLRYLQSHSFD
jgi:hypothetical protein